MPGQPGSETLLRGWRPTPGNNPCSFIHTALDGGDTRQQASMASLWSMPLISRACSQLSISAAHLPHCQAFTEQHRLLVKCSEYAILYPHFPPSFTHAHRTFVLHLPCSLVFHAGAPHRPALLDSMHTHPQQPRGCFSRTQVDSRRVPCYPSPLSLSLRVVIYFPRVLIWSSDCKNITNPCLA